MTNLMKTFLDAKYLQTTFTLSVRWITKPRWVPIAKTKKFLVRPQATFEYPGEDEEIRRLYNNYRSSFRGSLNLLKQMYRESEVSQEVIDAQQKKTEDFWQESVKINEEWNRQVAIEREKLNREWFEEQIRKAEEKMRAKDEETRNEQERLNALIREQEELSKTFITPEKLDEHVERILNSLPHSFNYALDVKGNAYDGFNATPTRKVNEDGRFLPLVPDKGVKSQRT